MMKKILVIFGLFMIFIIGCQTATVQNKASPSVSFQDKYSIDFNKHGLQAVSLTGNTITYADKNGKKVKINYVDKASSRFYNSLMTCEAVDLEITNEGSDLADGIKGKIDCSEVRKRNFNIQMTQFSNIPQKIVDKYPPSSRLPIAAVGKHDNLNGDFCSELGSENVMITECAGDFQKTEQTMKSSISIMGSPTFEEYKGGTLGFNEKTRQGLFYKKCADSDYIRFVVSGGIDFSKEKVTNVISDIMSESSC